MVSHVGGLLGHVSWYKSRLDDETCCVMSDGNCSCCGTCKVNDKTCVGCGVLLGVYLFLRLGVKAGGGDETCCVMSDGVCSCYGVSSCVGVEEGS